MVIVFEPPRDRPEEATISRPAAAQQTDPLDALRFAHHEVLRLQAAADGALEHASEWGVSGRNAWIGVLSRWLTNLRMALNLMTAMLP